MCVVCISYLCNCVMYLCVCAVCVCVWTYAGVQRPEVDARCPLSSSIFPSDSETFLKLEPTGSAPLAGQQAPGIHLLPELPTSLLGYTGVTDSCYFTQLPQVVQGPKLRSSVYIASTLSSEPCPQTLWLVPLMLLWPQTTWWEQFGLLGSQFQRISDHLGRLGMVLHYWEAWGSVNQEIGSVLLLRAGLFSKPFLKWAYFCQSGHTS